MFETAGAQSMFQELARKNATSYDAEVEKWMVKIGVPAARFGNAEDVGALCALLCSRFASYIIGQSLVIDGGQVRTIF
jgi:3-oxoacyl-[acyl-carrier protein] reductase